MKLKSRKYYTIILIIILSFTLISCDYKTKTISENVVESNSNSSIKDEALKLIEECSEKNNDLIFANNELNLFQNIYDQLPEDLKNNTIKPNKMVNWDNNVKTYTVQCSNSIDTPNKDNNFEGFSYTFMYLGDEVGEKYNSSYILTFNLGTDTEIKFNDSVLNIISTLADNIDGYDLNGYINDIISCDIECEYIIKDYTNKVFVVNKNDTNNNKIIKVYFQKKNE